MRTLLIALFSFCFSTALAQKADAETVRFIMSLDTVKENQQAFAIKQFIAETFPSQQGGNSPAYWLTKVRLLKAEKKKDSITYALNAVQLKDNQYELAVLHFVESLQVKNEYKSLAPHQTVKTLLQQTQIAEQHHCRNVYRLYDELAKYAYLNALSFGNYTESKKYVQQYIDHHPYKQHPRVRQRYYDICCMIALSEKNISDFEKYYALAAPLAKKLNEPEALNRLHQFEAEYYKLTGKNAQSLAIMQQSFQVAKKRRNLSPQLLLNMSRTFLQNKQYDSAIYYSREAIAMNRAIGADPANSFNYYRALNEAYKKKGDYRNAYYALDTVLTLFAAREKSIQADKNNELLTQFQTEKKDLQIRTLKINNELSEKRISQQKFLIIAIVFFLGVILVLFYLFYNRRLLKAKNKQLQAENKQLLLEQQTRQLQLNPHFIYNAIANLQGLIGDQQTERANSYLVAFSQFIRKQLELNREETITLQEEIEAIEIYVKLQQMRYENRFTFHVETDLDTEAYLIPPMLIQPFVENAIEHGFKNINYQGVLTLTIEEKDNKLHLILIDNGNGKGGPNPHKKSLSKLITQERLDLLFNTQQKGNAYFEAAPLSPPETGYRVAIVIPVIPS